MRAIIRNNERSHVIDLITLMNSILQRSTLQVKAAGGERTIAVGRNNIMFPDLLLYGDTNRTVILQGWEVKLPDTSITNEVFINDAIRKARSLNLNSFFIWNFTSGVLYIKNEQENFQIERQWNDTNHIRSRQDVETFTEDWHRAIEEILLDLNQFFLNGEISASTLGEVIQNTIVPIIIDRNKSIVADSLRNVTSRNATIQAELNLWWEEIRVEYFKDETNMYKAYAKTLILNWSNRILFAHLIKRIHNQALTINDIDEDTTQEQANDIFEVITTTCDFYHIFSRLNHNTNMPNETWTDFIDFNFFLIEHDVGAIEQTLLQTILENSVAVSRRESTGQYATPMILADLLAKITIIDWSDNCIDPCCGTGTISQAILKHKKTLFPTTRAVGTTWAADKYSYPLQVAQLSLTSADTINEPSLIFKHDVLSLSVGEIIQITNPQTGELIDLEIPLFGAISSNLPFISFNNLTGDNLELINETIENVRANTDILLSRKNDMYCFIIFALHNLVKDEGRIGVITSNSWLGTSAGKGFFKALNMYFTVNQIHISGNGKWFDNANVVSVILILTKKLEIGIPLIDSDITFCKWNKTLSEIDTNPTYSQTIINSALLGREIDTDIVTLDNYTQQQIEELQTLNISFNAMFHNVLWLLDIQDKLLPIERVFTIFRGERRGWDAMFYPEDGHEIELDCIKRVLKNAKGITSLLTEADRDAFCCPYSMDELTDMQYTGTMSWINRFENTANRCGRPLPETLHKANMYWYEMKDTCLADIVTTMNPNKRLFFAKLSAASFINQRLIGLRANQRYTEINLYHALLNSILSMFYIEASGFGRGLGVLDINKNIIKGIYMFNPDLISEIHKHEILDKFTTLCNRSIMDTDQELQDPSRIDFDRAVLRAFEIENHYDNIKNSLLSMQQARLSVLQH